MRATKRGKGPRNQPIMRCEALEKMCGATRRELGLIKQFLRVRRKRLQNFLRPASRKIDNKRLNACRRRNVDFVWLPVVQDKITRLIDRKPGAVCTVNCVPVE